MILSGILLVAVLISAAGACILDKRDNEGEIMQKFCKNECVCCQKRP